jgi:hypothetical protein
MGSEQSISRSPTQKRGSSPRAEREAAAEALSGFADKLNAAIDALAATIEPVAATVDPVTTRTPLANALLGVGVKGLLGQITAELRGVVTSARSHCSALVAGETATIRTPTAVEVLGQPPQIERTSVMLIGDAMGSARLTMTARGNRIPAICSCGSRI